jgi:hypothetical protein
LLGLRDESPTASTPLFYRERTYVVAASVDSTRAEEILRERYAELRDSLGGEADGRFFNLALFDHHWDDRPLRPPIATLQWKDWRGEPTVTVGASANPTPEAERSSGPPPPSPAPPAPSSTGALPTSPANPTPLEPSVATPSVIVDPSLGAEPSIRADSPLGANPSIIVDPSLAADPSLGADPTVGPDPSIIVDPSLAADPSHGAEVDRTPPPAPTSMPSVPGAPVAPTVEEPPHRQRRTTTDEQDARLAHAFEAAQDLLFLSTPLEGMDFVVQLLGDLVPSEAVTACLYDIDTDEFRLVALLGPGSDERRGEAIPRTVGLMGHAAENEGLVLRIDDLSGDPRYDAGIDGRLGLEPRNVLYMPLSHQGRLLGLLQLLNRVDTTAFSNADVELVNYVAKQAAQFLHQARIAPRMRSRA